MKHHPSARPFGGKREGTAAPRGLRALGGVVVLLLGIAGCADDPAGPVGSPAAFAVALSVADPALTTARAVDFAEEARIRVRDRETVLVDTTVALSSSGETRVSLELEVGAKLSRLTVDVQLSGGGILLFTGSESVDVSGGDAVRVEVELEPVLGNLEPVVDVATGDPGGIGLTCSLNVHGQAFCWGAAPGASEPRTRPATVDTDLRFTDLDAGGSHVCGLTEEGAAWCWGENGTGQLGDGTTTNRATPTAVIGGFGFTSIATGGGFTCGLTDDDQVLCWGRNDNQQLGQQTQACGDATFPCSSTPVRVEGLEGVTFLSAGLAHACASDANGPRCWGWNIHGQLGRGSADVESFGEPQPVAIGRLLPEVHAGTISSCGLDGSGAAWCWGSPFFDTGQFGDGAFDGQLEPAPVTGGLTFTSLSLAQVNDIFGLTACGVDPAGVAYCWGSNFEGQLGGTGGDTCVIGSESFDCAATPTAVDADVTFEMLDVANHVCGTTAEGKLFCWGANESGQLGDGTTTQRDTPIRVTG